MTRPSIKRAFLTFLADTHTHTHTHTLSYTPTHVIVFPTNINPRFSFHSILFRVGERTRENTQTTTTATATTTTKNC